MGDGDGAWNAKTGVRGTGREANVVCVAFLAFKLGWLLAYRSRAESHEDEWLDGGGCHMRCTCVFTCLNLLAAFVVVEGKYITMYIACDRSS